MSQIHHVSLDQHQQQHQHQQAGQYNQICTRSSSGSCAEGPEPSCPAYSTSVISGPRTEELGRSSSGSAFAPYAGSTAFTSASPGYNSHLPYSADAAAAATFTSYVVSKLKVIILIRKENKKKKQKR